MHPVDIEFDQVVQGITNSLLLRHEAESPSSQRCCIIEQTKNASIPRQKSSQNTNARRKAPGVRFRFRPGSECPASSRQISSRAGSDGPGT
jgi:hypothetical protein